MTITGANGYQVTGQALLNFAGTYPQGNQIVSNRDQIVYQGDYRFTPHLTATAGFHFEDERGAAPDSIVSHACRADELRLPSGGARGLQGPLLLYAGRESAALLADRDPDLAARGAFVLCPAAAARAIFSGTRVLFNFGEAVREPSLTDQFYSLYNFLETNGGQSTIAELHISPLGGPATRTYEGGLEQSFFGAAAGVPHQLLSQRIRTAD